MKLLIFIVIGFLTIAAPATAQDCTLAGTAVCNGVPCPGAMRSEGHVLYNEDFQVLQTCRNGVWKALTPMAAAPPDPCAGSPSPGTICQNGSIYAGVSPDGNVPMYTTPANAPGALEWGSFGTTRGTTSTTAGETNTTTLAGFGASAHPAAHYCDSLSAHGSDDWYLPAKDELNVLYTNNAAIGAFGNSFYWSSSENSNEFAWLQRLSDGSQTYIDKNNTRPVRCVRK